MTTTFEHVLVYDDYAQEFEWQSIADGVEEWTLFVDAATDRVEDLIYCVKDEVGHWTPKNWIMLVIDG